MSILLAMEGAISQGILWGLMTLGVYLTFRILNVADMTVDGSFAAGGAVRNESYSFFVVCFYYRFNNWSCNRFDEYKIKDKYSFGKYSFTNCIVFY